MEMTSVTNYHVLKDWEYFELLSIHGGEFSFLADGEGVSDRFSRGLCGDDKVVACLLDLCHRFDIFGPLDNILRYCWMKKYKSEQYYITSVVLNQWLILLV